MKNLLWLTLTTPVCKHCVGPSAVERANIRTFTGSLSLLLGTRQSHHTSEQATRPESDGFHSFASPAGSDSLFGSVEGGKPHAAVWCPVGTHLGLCGVSAAPEKAFCSFCVAISSSVAICSERLREPVVLLSHYLWRDRAAPPAAVWRLPIGHYTNSKSRFHRRNSSCLRCSGFTSQARVAPAVDTAQFLPCCLLLRYFYQTQRLTWDQAQLNCREHYTDLAVFESQEDVDGLQRPPGVVGAAWIGLREDPSTWKHMGNESTSWRWSATEETSQGNFSMWASHEPNNMNGEFCVFSYLGFWYDYECELGRPSVCFSGVAENTTYTYNPTHMTWSAAQAHCRLHHTDLASIESAEVSAALRTVLPNAATVWIGLYRIPFTWSNSNPSTFRNWGPMLPDNVFGIEFCGAEKDVGLWDDYSCSSTLLSICYSPDWKTRKTILKQKLSSAADLSRPEVLQQLQQQLTEILGLNRTDVRLQLKIEALMPIPGSHLHS
uniref:C-type lectin domain-containing protein n=1 Tax=Knipowitschia caucasica TaxID=637954 RepID=A0AAV2MFZ3_KNICA